MSRSPVAEGREGGDVGDQLRAKQGTTTLPRCLRTFIIRSPSWTPALTAAPPDETGTMIQTRMRE